MLNPEEQIENKKRVASKARGKLHDLTPRQDTMGGSAFTRNDPPLPIPPPGFIVPSDGEKKDGQR